MKTDQRYVRVDNILTRLKQLTTTIPKRVHQISPEVLSAKPIPDVWSKKEILGHLCDSALHNWKRFVYAQSQGELLTLEGYPQTKLVELNNYQNLSIGSIVQLWKSLNRQIIAVIRNISPENLNHPIQLPNGDIKDLMFLIEDYLRHLEHHLYQIFQQNEPVPTLSQNWSLSVKTAMGKLASDPNGKPFIKLLENGNMYIEIYQPKEVDLQTPHDQDEIYVVISGSGIFYNNGDRRPFQAGDLIFVPAGIEHHFENFTDDFKTWVIFY